MDARPEDVRAPAWRDPLSAGWRAHRQVLLLRLRWHENRIAPDGRRRRSRSRS